MRRKLLRTYCMFVLEKGVGGWIRAEGACKGGENCLKYLKRGVEQKRGEGKQRF